MSVEVGNKILETFFQILKIKKKVDTPYKIGFVSLCFYHN